MKVHHELITQTDLVYISQGALCGVTISELSLQPNCL